MSFILKIKRGGIKEGGELEDGTEFSAVIQTHQTISCENCGDKIEANYDKNAKEIRAECWLCGWKLKLNKKDVDLIQPSSPFFELIYNWSPQKRAVLEKRKKQFEVGQRKASLEEKYHRMHKEGRIKSWEEKT